MCGGSLHIASQQRMRWLDSVSDATNLELGMLRGSEREGSLVQYGPWGLEELNMT